MMMMMIVMIIGPMHEEKLLGNTPTNTYCLVLVLFFKVGMKTKTRHWYFWGVSQELFFFVHRAYENNNR